MDLTQLTGVFKAADVTPYEDNHSAWFPMPGEELLAMYKSSSRQLVMMHWPDGADTPETLTYELIMLDNKPYLYNIKEKVDGLTNLLDVVVPIEQDGQMTMQHQYFWSDEDHWRHQSSDTEIRVDTTAQQVCALISERNSGLRQNAIDTPFWRCIPTPPIGG